MSLRIRQIALVARELEPVVEHLRALFGIDVAFRDPGVGAFGLHNAVMPVGTQFLEVVSPVQEGTTAGRLLERRGDSGYMVIFETDDLDGDRERAERLGVRIVWDANLEDVRSAHLHPRDIGGAIVSLDQPLPRGSWRWGGPDWERHVRTDVVRRILSAELEARDPGRMARRWSEVLGLDAALPAGDGWRLDVDAGTIRFVPAHGCGEGVSALSLETVDAEGILARARARGIPVVGNSVTVAGTRIDLDEAST